MKKMTYSKILRRVYGMVLSEKPYLEMWIDILDIADAIMDLSRLLFRTITSIMVIPLVLIFGPIMAAVAFLYRNRAARLRELREQQINAEVDALHQ